MSQDNTNIASAINLSQIAQHPAEALAALVEVVQRQEKQISLLTENQEIQATLLAKLKAQTSPEPRQRDRGETLRAILVANGGKMFAKDCRRQMGLPENTFSELLKTQRDSIVSRPFHLDRRRIVLELI
jgi:hypothetical protein